MSSTAEFLAARASRADAPIAIPDIRVALILQDVALATQLGVQLVRGELSVEVMAPTAANLGAADASADVLVIDLAALEELEAAGATRPHDRRGRAATIAIALRREDGELARALAANADDCIVLPIEPRAFAYRVRAVMQRALRGRAYLRRLAPVECFGAIEVDVGARVVRRAGAPVTVAPRELDLLLALIARRGAAVTRAELMSELGVKSASRGSRVLDTLIYRLRAELEPDPSTPRHLVTVSRFGYRFER
ncbi:MAG: response regulator transcription factor [Gemmatimonadaceae bacterium]